MIVASRESVEDIFKWQTLKEPKLAQFDKVMCTWFTAASSEGKPMTERMIIEMFCLFTMKL
jgi:hypothetical protein